MHMHTPSTFVEIISTQLAVLPSKSAALLRPSPALFTWAQEARTAVQGRGTASKALT